jgi:polyisoprenoid-binding protein YceI
MRHLLALCLGMGLLAGSLGPRPAAAADLTPVPMQAGTVRFGPENTKIQFVGTHVGPRPDPRVGGFAKFTGTLTVDPAAKTIQSVSVEIDTNSLFTEIDRLTNHLKSADFFEVRRYPTAKFESTKITASQGQAQITGNLTLHGVTKELSFPAEVQFSGSGLTLKSEFSVNRTDFNMNFGPDRVVNKVSLTVIVGEKTQTR